MEGEKGTTSIDGQGGGSVGGGKEESLGLKLRGGICVSRKVGHCTPVPSWKVEEEEPIARSEEVVVAAAAAAAEQRRSSVSVRKLGASLWEMQEILGASSGMSPDGGIGMIARRRRDRSALDLVPRRSALNRVPRQSAFAHDNGPCTAGSMRRHLADSMINHYKLKDSDYAALRVESPASCSSMEIDAFNQVMTPSSSLNLKGKLGECGYNLKTSAELVKVLNRIWSLEEQQTSNISLVKALKVDLDHARGCIQELMLEQYAYRNEMDELLKKVHKDNLNRKSKEQHKLKSVVQSIRDDVEDERHLRRHSESLHKKLAKELSEVKAAYTGVVKELERKRKINGLLEDLCDEFANSVKDYEQEVRVFKQKSKEDCGGKVDCLVLHFAEAWIDERIQMKVAERRGDLTEKSIFAERLNNEIESFLGARRSTVGRCGFVHQKGSKIASDKQRQSRESICIDCNMQQRQSLESVHLNGTVSAPQDAEDDDSIASDLRCFELNVATRSQSKPNGLGVTDELDPLTTSTNGLGITDEHCNNYQGVETHGHSTFRGQFVLVSNGNASQYYDHASSPAQQWKYRDPSDLNVIEPSSKASQGVKGHTLKARLLEARLDGQHARRYLNAPSSGVV